MDGLEFIIPLIIALVGAVLFVFFWLVPAMNGNEVNMPGTYLGIALIIVGIAMEVFIGLADRGN